MAEINLYEGLKRGLQDAKEYVDKKNSKLSESIVDIDEKVGDGFFETEIVNIGEATAGNVYGAKQALYAKALQEGVASFSFFGFDTSEGEVYDITTHIESLSEGTVRNLVVVCDADNTIIAVCPVTGTGGAFDANCSMRIPDGAVKCYINTQYASKENAEKYTVCNRKVVKKSLTDAVMDVDAHVNAVATRKISKEQAEFIVSESSSNIIKDDDIVSGGYYTSTGYKTYSTWGYIIVPVKSGDVIRSRYKANTKGYLGVFDSNGTYSKIDSFVTYHDDNTSFRWWEVTVPDDVNNIIINLSDISTSKYSWLVVTNNSDFPTEYVPYEEPVWTLSDEIVVEATKDSHLTSDWTSMIQTVQNAQGTKFTFAVQTDTHINFGKTGNMHNADVCNNLKELTTYIGFDFVCNLGDIIEGYTVRDTADAKSDMTEIVHRYIDGACCPVLFAVGNHDDNEQSNDTEIITNGDLYARLIKPMRNTSDRFVFDGKVAYYYADFDDVRVIVLNTQDGTRAGQFNISTAQATWFSNKALDTDKSVVVMGHAPLVSGIGSNIPTNANAILNAVDAFKNKGGTVIGFFYGHEHAQNSTIVNGINHICFRHAGTRAEVVMVDLDTKTISTIVVGNRNDTTDRTFSF